MHRFFVAKESIEDGSATVSGPPVRQMRDVLRLKPGNRIILLDNSGSEYEIELTELGKVVARGKVLRKTEANTEARTQIILYQGFLKGDKFDFVLQKCTELGVQAFVPVLCERSIAGRGVAPGDSRLVRWQRILQESAEQSHRVRIPEIHDPMDLPSAIKTAKGFSLLAWESESSMGLHEAIVRHRQRNSENNPPIISLFIGPEGGFSTREAVLAETAGVSIFSLGPRILRAETAGIVAASLVLYELSEMEPRVRN